MISPLPPAERSRFRSAFAQANDWTEACRICARQLDPVPPEATLGFVYASDPLSEALDLIATELRRLTGVADWAGAGGLGVCGTGAEQVGQGALAVLLCTLPAASFHLLDGLIPGDDAPPADRLGGGVGVVHADPRLGDVPSSLAALAERSGAFLVGGLASSRVSGIQIAGRPVEGGLSGVLFTPDVEVAATLSQGCTPIGPVHEVTSATGPWLTRLDGRPALQVLKDEIGEILARQLDQLGGFIHAALPVRASDRPDYLVRNLIGLDTAKDSIAVGAEIRRGDRLMFVKRDAAAARSDLDRALADLRRRVDGRPIRGALYHSCIARGPNLFGPGAQELVAIERALGPVPLAGLFADGEIFRDRLYAYTGVLTVFL